MQQGYFGTAWNDIKNSPKWLSKMMVMALLFFIPIFGPIVVAGYLYGWARDIAWGVHSPMPAKIFGNEDGRLYSRGFFALVIAFVFMIVPSVLETIFSAVFGFGVISSAINGDFGGAFLATGIFGFIFSLLSLAIYVAVTLFQWVGNMRMSIYGRLSAGFQINKIWAMIRHDFKGILKILGMVVLVTVVVSIVFALIIGVVMVVILAVAAGAGVLNLQADHLTGSVVAWSVGLILLALLLSAIAYYVFMVITVFIETLFTRALGYWTRQFDVPNWRGQDDPMPFELQNQAAGTGVNASAYHQPAQQPGQAYQQPEQAYQQPTQPYQQQPPKESETPEK